MRVVSQVGGSKALIIIQFICITISSRCKSFPFFSLTNIYLNYELKKCLPNYEDVYFTLYNVQLHMKLVFAYSLPVADMEVISCLPWVLFQLHVILFISFLYMLFHPCREWLISSLWVNAKGYRLYRWFLIWWKSTKHHVSFTKWEWGCSGLKKIQRS